MGAWTCDPDRHLHAFAGVHYCALIAQCLSLGGRSLFVRLGLELLLCGRFSLIGRPAFPCGAVTHTGDERSAGRSCLGDWQLGQRHYLCCIELHGDCYCCRCVSIHPIPDVAILGTKEASNARCRNKNSRRLITCHCEEEHSDDEAISCELDSSIEEIASLFELAMTC